jgi:hypothetical protein
MIGATQRGDRAELLRRVGRRATPRNEPLAPHQVRDLQAIIALGLKIQGYTRNQIAQIIPVSESTIDRRLPRVAAGERV